MRRVVAAKTGTSLGNSGTHWVTKAERTAREARYTSDVTPYVVGEQDFHDGRKRTACPYSEENNPVPAAEWREGWDRAQIDDREARNILGA